MVMMNFSKRFNINTELMAELKKSLCDENTCPPIYLNAPQDFEGEIFFKDFKNIDSITILETMRENSQKYLN